MEECPFCSAEVPQQLTLAGGTCPRCFAHIPGEEAATDPGPAPSASVERPGRAQRLVRALGLAVVTGSLVFGLAAALLWPTHDAAALLDFDAIDYPVPDIVSAPATRAPEAAPARVAVRQSEPEADATADEPPSWDLSLSGPRVRRDDRTVITDPAAIRSMVGDRMLEQIPGLQVCYDRRLKVVPNLEGRWRLVFTVAPIGRVAEAVAEGIETRDAALEECLVQHVREHWRFAPVATAQPVTRTLRFDRK